MLHSDPRYILVLPRRINLFIFYEHMFDYCATIILVRRAVCMAEKRGKIIIPANVNVWPHELDTAKALAVAGKTVEFIQPIEGQRVHTPDIQMDGVAWELKAPESGSSNALQKNLRRALHQSCNIIIDCRRMKTGTSQHVERELRQQATKSRSLKRLLLVRRDGSIVDIMR